jgi:hypothetical protein
MLPAASLELTLSNLPLGRPCTPGMAVLHGIVLFLHFLGESGLGAPLYFDPSLIFPTIAKDFEFFAQPRFAARLFSIAIFADGKPVLSQEGFSRNQPKAGQAYLYIVLEVDII